MQIKNTSIFGTPAWAKTPRRLLCNVNCFKTRDICSFCLLSIISPISATAPCFQAFRLYPLERILAGLSVQMACPPWPRSGHVTQARPNSCPVSGILTQQEIPAGADWFKWGPWEDTVSVTSSSLDVQLFWFWSLHISFDSMSTLYLPSKSFCRWLKHSFCCS